MKIKGVNVKKVFTNKKINVFKLIVFILLLVYSFVFIAMLAWAFLSSLKDHMTFRDNILGMPDWKWDNYITSLSELKIRITTPEAITVFKIPALYMNSFIYSFGCTITALVAHYLIAYAIAFFKYRFGKFLKAFVIVAMAIPIMGTDASMVSLMRDLYLYDTFFGIIALKGGFLGMYTLVMIAAFENVPGSLKEAAQLDGASELCIMFKIIFPSMLNILGVIFLLYFVTYWNDYQTPMLYLPSQPTMAYGVYYFNNSTNNSISAVPYKLCGAMFMCIPVLLLYAIFNKKLLAGNMTIGAVKG